MIILKNQIIIGFLSVNQGEETAQQREGEVFLDTKNPNGHRF